MKKMPFVELILGDFHDKFFILQHFKYTFTTDVNRSGDKCSGAVIQDHCKVHALYLLSFNVNKVILKLITQYQGPDGFNSSTYFKT